MEYGFSEKLGNVVYSDDNSEPFVGMEYGHSKARSEKLQADIDSEVRSIIDKCYDSTVVLLKEHIDKLHLVAKSLMVREKLDGSEFTEIMEGKVDTEKIESDYQEFKKNADKKLDILLKKEVPEDSSETEPEKPETEEKPEDAPSDETSSEDN